MDTTADQPVVSSRGVRQYLQSLERAGVTALPRPTAEALPADSPADASTVDNSPIATSTDAVLPMNPSAPKSEPTTDLVQLAACVADCRRCAELAETRTQTVFGVGDPDARLLFIGEAPGADEDRLGEPFVGRAGQLLTKIIEACKLKREDVYICNILKCRPPGNRNPTGEEAANCREFLDGQIAAVNPEYIVCWGSVAAKNLLDRKESIGKMRRRFYVHGDAKVLCTYHPSYLLRNPAAKKDVWDDMKFLFADMGITLTAGDS